MEISGWIKLSDDFLSEMPLDECSAAMSFQVGFKSVGFFFVFKGNRVFDTPWSEFRCMRHIAFIVFFQTGSQIFGTADVEMGFGCFIYENINVVEVGHQRKSFRITFVVVRCRVARLHLLRRLRRGSLPLAVFVLRTSPSQACSLVDPFAAQLACRGEISALPRWRLVGAEGLEPPTFTV